jgi:hypothetical protein
MLTTTYLGWKPHFCSLGRPFSLMLRYDVSFRRCLVCLRRTQSQIALHSQNVGKIPYNSCTPSLGGVDNALTEPEDPLTKTYEQKCAMENE